MQKKMQNFMNQAREQVTNLAERAKEMLPGQKDKQAGQPGQATDQSAAGVSSSAASGSKAFDMSQLSIKQDISRNRFSCMLDNEEAYVDYKLNDLNKTIEISYLYVPPAYREKGIASRLLTDCHSFARAKGYSCTPSSEAKPFVEKWLSENPQFKDTCHC